MVAIRLRISTHDRRAPFGLPVALIDADSGALISVHKSLADGMRAKSLIEAVYTRDFDATELSGLAAETSQRLFGVPEFERLSLGKLGTLINAMKIELLSRRRRH